MVGLLGPSRLALTAEADSEGCEVLLLTAEADSEGEESSENECPKGAQFSSTEEEESDSTNSD